jgi:hypothetical protein
MNGLKKDRTSIRLDEESRPKKRDAKAREKLKQVLQLSALNVKPRDIRKQVGLTIDEVYQIRRKARLLTT